MLSAKAYSTVLCLFLKNIVCRILLNLMNNDSKKEKEKDEQPKPEDMNSVYENSQTKIT